MSERNKLEGGAFDISEPIWIGHKTFSGPTAEVDAGDCVRGFLRAGLIARKMRTDVTKSDGSTLEQWTVQLTPKIRNRRD